MIERGLRLLLLVVVAAMWASPATAVDPLDNVPLAIGTDGGVFNEARNDGRNGELGRWELLEGRLGPNAVHLKFNIEPPPHGLPVQSGPSVLFGGLDLYGDAGGDVAYGARVRSFAAVTMAPCQDPGCRSVVEIALPVNNLAAAIKRLEQEATLIWVSAELTLVRTYAGGTWLQVMPFATGAAAPRADGGRLGAIVPATGTMFPYGLFQADEATAVPADLELFPRGFEYAAAMEVRRRAAGDATLSLPTVLARLRVTIDPPCEGSNVLTLHDDSGDRVFDRPLNGLKTIEEEIQIPVGVRWWFTLHDGGGIDFDQGRQGSGVRVGPIGTAAEPINIDAAFDCSAPRGIVRVDGAIVAPTEAPPSAGIGPDAAASPPASSPAPVAPSGAPAGPTTTAQPALAVITILVGLVLLVSFGRRRDHRR